MPDKEVLERVCEALRAQNFRMDNNSLRLHEHQGWMSTVYTASSEMGRLVIHVSPLISEHLHNRVWEKFGGLREIFDAHPEIQTPRIVCVKRVKNFLLLVQVFVLGKRAGFRQLERGKCIDKWDIEPLFIRPRVLLELSKVHSIPIPKFGWPHTDRDPLRGTHDRWRDFLGESSRRWLGTIESIEEDSFVSRLRAFVNNIMLGIEYEGGAVLVHGDSINPGNIIVDEENKVTLLDWEWAIAADPAWEFCDIGWHETLRVGDLETYFKERQVNDRNMQRAFIRRALHYIPLWLLWGMHMHAEDSDNRIYTALKFLLEEEIRKNKK